MKRNVIAGIACFSLIVLLLSGCGTAPQTQTIIDPEQVSAKLKLEPEEPKTGGQTKMIIEVKGPVTLKNTQVYIELKREAESKKQERVDFKQESAGIFEAFYEFKHPDKYTAVIHTVAPEVHKISGGTFHVK